MGVLAGYRIGLATFIVIPLVAGCGDRKNHAEPSAERSGQSATPPAPSSATSAHRRPPKANRRKKSSAPTLPVVSKQDKAPPNEPITAARSKSYPCGSVRVGADDIPLACVDPTGPGEESPSHVVVPYALMPAGTEALPEAVDHRDSGMEGPTRNQGHSSACTAFATTSSLDHALALWTGKVEPISVMQVWGEYHATNQNVANQYIMGKSFGPEASWPFDAAVARSWEAPDKCGDDAKQCGQPVDSNKLGAMSKQGIIMVTQIERLWSRPANDKGHEPTKDVPFELLRAKLAAGRDLTIGLRMPTRFKPVAVKGDTSGAQYIPDDLTFGDKPGGHFIAVVGYSVVEDGSYFLLKNSWGTQWGQNGYAWIHDVTLSRLLGTAFVIDGEPVGAAGLKPARVRAGQVDSCPSPQIPDAVTGSCSPACTDGSPTTNGTCGETDGCERGEINVTGECVIAAPKVKGTEPTSGVGFECAAGGCVYNLPKGFAGCRDHCQKSCPAPDFRLARGPLGLSCVE